MAKNKTKETGKNVLDFIKEFAESEQKRKDSYELLELMQNVSGYEARMWGPSIIGFGNYHYKYASGHEGDAPLIGFSPRKAAISLYVFTGLKEHEHLLKNFGKFKIGKACIYIKKLSDIDKGKLKELMKTTINYLQTKYNNG
ncbi:DUF1801 domain-containing protein [Flavihumibacter fluvii]|uniref:DUF1801 domain-containing protein n=1 Tax=Flavihumibacter fluvii TaxID=2838157 RepID=UPI001BDED1CD|nr:DUF1801 domain-containing protein [Flavihumibacter fluvii]ULQ51524.1 DUF1801 domain-containing protein [Flavihumibacter fluvii]